MRTKFLIAIIIVFGAIVSPVHAAGKACTRLDAISAEAESSTLKNWDHVYRSFKRYAPCDDGAIGEGYSDSVARLLSSDWAHVGNLGSLASQDKMFEAFILHHIDELMTPDQARTIAENANNHCPKDSVWYCMKIAAKINDAQKPPVGPSGRTLKIFIGAPAAYAAG